VAGASDNGLSELRQSHASRGTPTTGVITVGDCHVAVKGHPYWTKDPS
jgi:hypothetical protein